MFDITIGICKKLIFTKEEPEKVLAFMYYIISILMGIMGIGTGYLYFVNRGATQINMAIISVLCAVLLWPRVRFQWYIRAFAFVLFLKAAKFSGY